MPMKKRFEFIVSSQKCAINWLRGNCCRQRQITGRKALCDAQKIRRNALLFAGEHGPRATETGGDLINDEKNLVLLTEFRDMLEITFGHQEHPGCPLNKRFHHDRGYRTMMSTQY